MKFALILYPLIGIHQTANAGSNQSLVYQGRVLRPDGKPINSGTVAFTLSVYSPSPAKCLLYSENQSVNMTGANGFFNLALGAGSRSDGGTHTFDKIFMNAGSITGLVCENGDVSYSPAATDDRTLIATFNDAGQVVTLSAMSVKSVPFALQAQEIGGYGINDLLKVHPSISTATTFNAAELAKVKALGAVATCATNEILKWNGSIWTCATDISGGSASDASYSAKGIVQFDTNAATSGISIASGVAKLSDVNSNTGSFGGAAKAISLAVNAQGRITAASEANIALPVGQLTQSGANTGEVLKWNGSSWSPATDSTGSVPGDASYAAKGLVQGLTDAAASGLVFNSGVLSVHAGTGANQILKLDGGGKLPAVDGSALTNLNVSSTTGSLPTSNGGTGQTTYTAGDILYASSASATAKLGIGATGTILSSTGSAPQWSTFSSLGVFSNGGNSFGAATVIGTNDSQNLSIETAGTTRVTVDINGRVGIGSGTTNPSTALDVNGAIRSRVVDNSAGTTIDWSAGNVQYTTAPCAGATWTMNNMLDGGSYTLIVKSSGAHTGTCTFSGSSVSSWRFRPANATPSGSSHVIYTFLRAGSDVYISWIEGF